MTKTVRMKFKNNEGKVFTVSLANASPALEEEGGDVVARAVIGQLMQDQPFSNFIEECTGVDVMEHKVHKVI